jgi:leucyl aminopeptidase (aminopeptidase T)
MKFGPVTPDLMPGAQNAVNTCLAIRRGERVVLIADRASSPSATCLAEALSECGARWTGYLVEDLVERPMAGAPPELVHALEAADAGILCVQPMEGELRARMEIVAVVERRQIRYAHMVGITPDIMRQGMRADYRLVDRLSERLLGRMRSAQRLTVRSEGGTAFSATFDSALQWVKTSGLISPRYWSNLPAGEVFTTPATLDGTFVCDGMIGDYFGPKYGDLRRTPMVLDIGGGRLRSVRSDRHDLAEEFWAYCHTDPNSDRIGELAFGTNLELSEMIGVLLQDEKVPGVHIAFGDPYGSQTRAPWTSATHVDVLTRECDVWIDDEPVIARGRYLLDRLGLVSPDSMARQQTL